MTATLHSGGANYTPNSGVATYRNVKIFKSTDQTDDNWNGTLSDVIVSNGAISSFEITNAGSGWQVGQKGYFDTSVVGSGNTYLDGSVAGAGLTSGNIGVSSDLVIQFTG